MSILILKEDHKLKKMNTCFAPTKIKLFPDHPAKSSLEQGIMRSDDTFQPCLGIPIFVHRNLSHYFSPPFNSDLKSKDKEINIDQEAFKKIRRCLYGFPLQFQRNSQIYNLLETVHVLGVHKIEGFLISDLQTNFEEYSIFILLKVALRLGLNNIMIRCIKELARDNFQQFYIQKFDLFSNGEELLAQSMKHHQKIKSLGLAKGLKQKRIRELIKQYNTLNQTSLDADKILSLDGILMQNVYTEMDNFKQSQQNYPIVSKHKRQCTWNHTTEGKEEKVQSNFKKAYSALETLDWKLQDEIQVLICKNEKMMKNSKEMINDIKMTRTLSTLYDQNHNEEDKTVQINAKLTRMRKSFQAQNSKLERIKQLVQEMK